MTRVIENWELLSWKTPREAGDLQPSHQGRIYRGTLQPQRTYEQRNSDQELKARADLQLSRFFEW